MRKKMCFSAPGFLNWLHEPAHLVVASLGKKVGGVGWDWGKIQVHTPGVCLKEHRCGWARSYN